MSFSRKKTNDAEPAKKSKGEKSRGKSQEGTRETVEAVAIAFILAFVFKTFEAEAFVIPTGSMAPTLYGRHKDVTCGSCGLEYTVGASQEIDQETGILMKRLTISSCPNCRHYDEIQDAPVFNGDRIVVNKQVSRYKRFDVVVFKNPEQPHVNYIKRLVGLPGETVRIRQGDIQTRQSAADPWVVQCKEDPEKQRAIQLLVYDDQYPPRGLLAAGAEERWVPAAWDSNESAMGGWLPSENAWTANREDRTYAVDAKNDQLQWLRYRHLIPDRDAWRDVEAFGKLEKPLQAQLIADFCGFNSDGFGEGELYWVSDLTLDCTVSIESAGEKSRLIFELADGVRTIQCQINPVTGLAELFLLTRTDGTSASEQETIASVVTNMQGPGVYDICLANVDDRVCLWIDGDLVPLGEKSKFPPSELNLPSNTDLAPIGIAVSEMKGVVSDLVVRRDIYYRNDVLHVRGLGDQHPAVATEVEGSAFFGLQETLTDPGKYSNAYGALLREQEERFGDSLEFPLREGEYLMFGDNSPASKDSRLFDHDSRPFRGIDSHRYAVREQDLIGEALCIFWPHGIPFLNGGKGFTVMNHKQYSYDGKLEEVKDYPLYRAPFYPNLSRMKWIR